MAPMMIAARPPDVRVFPHHQRGGPPTTTARAARSLGTVNEPFRVIVAGGGVAGLEALMALRSLAGERVALTLVAPGTDFVYRPLAVAEPFGGAPAVTYPLDRVAADFHAELLRGELAGVDPDTRTAKLAGGAELTYDALVVALGARPYAAWDHVPTFRGPPDTEAAAALVRDLESGQAGSVAFVVPRGVTWPLPIYELALLTAARAHAAGSKAEIVVVTPESRPLAVFGSEASDRVSRALDAAGVGVSRGVTADITHNLEVVVPSEDTPLQFERVMAGPLLAGPAVPGLPADSRGFLPVDEHSRVRGTDRVYAAGDGTDFSVKQGGVAAQQAVAAAESIAHAAGAPVEPRPLRPVLRAMVLGVDGGGYLRAEAPHTGGGLSSASDTPLWWPAHKIASAHLGPYLADRGVVLDPWPAGTQPGAEAEEVLVPIEDWVEQNPYGE